MTNMVDDFHSKSLTMKHWPTVSTYCPLLETDDFIKDLPAFENEDGENYSLTSYQEINLKHDLIPSLKLDGSCKRFFAFAFCLLIEEKAFFVNILQGLPIFDNMKH